MRHRILFLLAIAFSFTANCATDQNVTQNHWPKRVFAPYMYVGAGDDFKLTDCDAQCGQKFYTLAFIIARQDGNGKNTVYHPEPSWDGRIPIEQNFYADQIDAIRKRGGDVIMSFGGEAGKELANEIDDPVKLEAAYQKVIDQYKFTWLDFDVEGNNLDKGKLDSERRDTVLARLQKKNPGLIISYTLPVDPNGLSDASLALLSDAVKKGVKVHSVNLMVMYFGKSFVGKGKSEGELGVESAIAAHAQIQKIDPTIKIGLCPCLGRNGSREEVFGLDDARTLAAFAGKTPWVCSLSYWSINDDAARPRKRRIVASTTNKAGVVNSNTHSVTVPGANPPWAFVKIFQPFDSHVYTLGVHKSEARPIAKIKNNNVPIAGTDPFTKEDWGAMTNSVQMSISIKAANEQIKTDQSAILLIRVRNVSTNGTLYFDEAFRDDIHPVVGISLVITSPSGRDASPKIQFGAGSSTLIRVPLNETREFEFDLGKSFQFSEIGTGLASVLWTT